jgi:hypothetical protein
MDEIMHYGLLAGLALVPITIVFALSAAFYGNITGADAELYARMVVMAAVMIGLGIFIIWLLLGAARYFLSFLRGHPGGFGWERPSLHRWIDIGTTAKADLSVARSNHTEIVSLPPAEGRKGLRHSGLYEDRRILKALAYWMAHVK